MPLPEVFMNIWNGIRKEYKVGIVLSDWEVLLI